MCVCEYTYIYIYIYIYIHVCVCVFICENRPCYLKFDVVCKIIRRKVLLAVFRTMIVHTV